MPAQRWRHPETVQLICEVYCLISLKVCRLERESARCNTIPHWRTGMLRLSGGSYSASTLKKSTLFSGHYLRNRSTLDIGVWVISVYFNIRNTLPKFFTFLPGHPVYIYIYIYTYIMCGKFFVRTDSGVRATKVKRQIYRCKESDCCSVLANIQDGGKHQAWYMWHYVPDVFELDMNMCLSRVGKEFLYKNAML
jgi:hypothetical protein